MIVYRRFNLRPQHVTFDKQLLNYIENHRHDEAKSMLSKYLARAYDHYGALLHYAADCDNDVIAQELIALGADVNFLDIGARTPLQVSVKKHHASTIQVLIEADASIESALSSALDESEFYPKILNLFTDSLKTKYGTVENIAKVLIANRCNMHHAAYLKDVNLLKCMLHRGVDIDSRSVRKRTALHAAVEINNLDLARWLINNGANIDALDIDMISPLTGSVECGYINMTKYLLEQGADPNITNWEDPFENISYTTLYAAINSLRYMKESERDLKLECAELLLHHGAVIKSSENLIHLFEVALECSCENAVKLVISHVAILQLLGSPIIKSVLYYENGSFRLQLVKFEEYYNHCLQILKTVIFRELSLLDLLEANGQRLRLLGRNKIFLTEIEDFCSEHDFRQLYPYYYNKLMTGIDKASCVVKLEDEATPVICILFKSDYNQCYTFATKILGYLDINDLESLLRVL